MNYLNDNALEELALRVVRSYLKTENVPQDRVDPVALCEKVLSLRVIYMTLSLDSSILGLTSFGNSKANVLDEEGDWAVMPLTGNTVLIEKGFLDNPIAIGRHNFTVAHEAAHHIFNMVGQTAAEKNRLHIYRAKKYTSVEFDEWQTDRLTAAILMNKPMLFSAMREAGIPNGIRVLDQRADNEEWSGFCRTAEILGVSLSALETRMDQLHLIERNYYHGKFRKGSILDVC